MTNGYSSSIPIPIKRTIKNKEKICIIDIENHTNITK